MNAPLDAGLMASLRGLDPNGRLLFLTRVLRMFGYGFLAVVLVLYLAGLGLDPLTIGLILTLTLVAGSLLMAGAGLAFALTSSVPLLILAATIGVISPTGNEVGPFLAVEQAALSQATPDSRRTPTFAWYNLAGYVATAIGALAAGFLGQMLLAAGYAPVDAYRAVVVGYAIVGLLMAVVFWRVGAAVEAPPGPAAQDGIGRRL